MHEVGPMDAYTPVRRVGSGTYGDVLHAVDTKGDFVAIKIMNSHTLCVSDPLQLPEVATLRRLPPHPNIIRLIRVVVTRDHTHLIFEYAGGGTLLNFLRSSGPLKEHMLRNIAFRILQGLYHIHTNSVIHRDLKLENILLTSETGDANGDIVGVKIADFGLSRAQGSRQNTDYVSTRWYRAPELLLHYSGYGPPIDIWAAGCCFAELLTGDPLFPGDTEIQQLQLICAFLKPLKPDACKGAMHALPRFITENMTVSDADIYTLAEAREALRRELGCSHVLADLLAHMLAWNPEDRITAQRALMHQFFAI
ncbi:Cyclin-dependent protein kinase, CMGC RCK [Giardia duodenalis]|nr:Cyclin-dependent protein kinase, CMGC RCK [Giardia intestinalis]